MIGVYLDVFGEALKRREGHINVDFLKANTSGRPRRLSFAGDQALSQGSAAALQETPHHHDEIEVLETRFGTDQVYGPHFTVTVGSEGGRRRSTSKALAEAARITWLCVLE
jgi:hypothetical protein